MTNYTLLTPGPTPVPEYILKRLAEPLYHHRTPEFGKILNEIFADLKYLFQTKEGEVFLLSASGTGAMETAIVNFFSPGEKVLVCPIGAFGERWASMTKAFGLDVEALATQWGNPLDVSRVKDFLVKNPDTAGVFVTHVDTSTATLNPLKELGEVVGRSRALFLVDGVSSLGGEEFYQDAWGIDVCASASQKGLMCPPGIALISVSPRALKKMAQAKCPRFYWDLKAYQESKVIPETPFTPPVSLLVGLHEALRHIKKETLETCWRNYSQLARFCRDSATALECPIFSKAPANVLTAARLPEGLIASGANSTEILKHIRDTFKIAIADGQGNLKGKIFRIAHMGAITRSDVERGLKALEETFAKLAAKV